MTTTELNPERWNLDHREPLLRFALQRVSDYGTAEDLVQEAFLSAWNGRGQFRGDCAERSWLVGILRNKIIDHYRRSARRHAVLASDLEAAGTEDSVPWIERQAEARGSHDPILRLDRREFMADLDEALSLMPEKMAKAFRLREIEGLATEDITRRLGISKANLWVLIHRAKQSLAGSLAGRWSSLPVAELGMAA